MLNCVLRRRDEIDPFTGLQLMSVTPPIIIGTLRFATTDGWTRVARCLGDWIEYGALWRVVARKLKLSCYTTNYVLREIAAVEFTLKMSFQKVRDELIYCFADGILDEEEFVLLYDAYESTNSIYPYWEYDEFSLDPLSSDECLADFRVEKDDIPRLAEALTKKTKKKVSFYNATLDFNLQAPSSIRNSITLHKRNLNYFLNSAKSIHKTGLRT